MKILPAWMWRDPADVAESVEIARVRAEERARLRALARENRFERAEPSPGFEGTQRSTLGSMVFVFRRALAAPPEIRMKRARIRALARAAMKEEK